MEQTSYVVLMPTLSRTALLLPHVVLLPIDVHLILPLGSGHRADLTFPARNLVWPSIPTPFGMESTARFTARRLLDPPRDLPVEAVHYYLKPLVRAT